MKIETLLTLTTKEQNQIEDFGDFINKICDAVGRTNCKSGCIFENFCSYPHDDVSYDFLNLLEEEFECNVTMDFEED